MPDLITVPTFTYYQGDIFNGDDPECERPIHVDYYNGSICLRQDDGYNNENSISISPKYMDKLFKEIKKHLPDALVILNR